MDIVTVISKCFKVETDPTEEVSQILEVSMLVRQMWSRLAVSPSLSKMNQIHIKQFFEFAREIDNDLLTEILENNEPIDAI